MSDQPATDSVTLQCHKTGREYEADVTIEDGKAVVDAACPYCENRGAEAILDDLRQSIEDLEKRT